MSTLQLNGKDLASQTSSAECVIASAVTGSPTIALTNATGTMPTGTQDNITRLGTVTAGTVSSTSFTVRAGSANAASTYFNGLSGARYLGGVVASSITIMEMQA